MDVRKITDDYSVSPQITPDDVPILAEAGFKSILCNRPDGEEFGQTDYDAIAAAARAAGLEAQCIPVSGGMVSAQIATDFQAALTKMPKPILAYCRSGTRCTMLWTIAQIEARDGDEIIRLTAQAGYDMSGLVRQLQTG